MSSANNMLTTGKKFSPQWGANWAGPRSVLSWTQKCPLCLLALRRRRSCIAA